MFARTFIQLTYKIGSAINRERGEHPSEKFTFLFSFLHIVKNPKPKTSPFFIGMNCTRDSRIWFEWPMTIQQCNRIKCMHRTQFIHQNNNCNAYINAYYSLCLNLVIEKHVHIVNWHRLERNDTYIWDRSEDLSCEFRTANEMTNYGLKRAQRHYSRIHCTYCSDFKMSEWCDRYDKTFKLWMQNEMV